MPKGIGPVEVAGCLDRCLVQRVELRGQGALGDGSFGSGPGRDDTREVSLGFRDRPRTFWSSCALSASSATSSVITGAEVNAKKRELLGRM